MNLSQEEIDILRIYTANSHSATIHNLSVAALYFEASPQSKVYSELLAKIKKMTSAEYHSIQLMLYYAHLK